LLPPELDEAAAAGAIAQAATSDDNTNRKRTLIAYLFAYFN
jgi:hypothetical protein